MCEQFDCDCQDEDDDGRDRPRCTSDKCEHLSMGFGYELKEDIVTVRDADLALVFVLWDQESYIFPGERYQNVTLVHAWVGGFDLVGQLTADETSKLEEGMKEKMRDE